MRSKRKTAFFTSVALALALSLSACATDDNPDNGDDTGDVGVTTTVDQMTTTTLP